MLLPYMAGFLGNYLEKYIHLGVAVSMFTAFSFAYTNNIPDYIYVVWTGLAAIWLYNNHDILSKPINQWHRLARGYSNVAILILIITGGIRILIGTPGVLLSFLVAAGLTMSYYSGLASSGTPLKSHFVLKHLVIGLVYGIIGVVVPAQLSGYSITEATYLSAGRIAFVAVLAILFDIGEAGEEGSIVGRGLLPSRAGVEKTRVACLGLLIFACLTDWLAGSSISVSGDAQISLGLTYILAGLLVYISDPQFSRNYYLLVVDGLLAVPWLLMVLLRLMAN